MKAKVATKVTAYLDGAGNLHTSEEAAVAASIATLGKTGLQRILVAKDEHYQPHAQAAILRAASMIQAFSK